MKKTILLFSIVFLLVLSIVFATDISDCTDLQNIELNKSDSYILINDIDCTGINFNTIGDISNKFTGTLDGDGYIIYNFSFSSSLNTDGMFRFTNGATIKNLGLVNVNVISTSDQIGALAGEIDGTTKIDNCFVTGKISGISNIGGVVGIIKGTSIINNSYTRANVTRSASNGGLFLGAWIDGTIENCYTAGYTNIANGGFTSYFGTGTFTNLFYDNSSGIIDSGVALGKNTADMKTQETFTNWDFTTIWDINGINDGYPYLRIFPIPLECTENENCSFCEKCVDNECINQVDEDLKSECDANSTCINTSSLLNYNGICNIGECKFNTTDVILCEKCITDEIIYQIYSEDLFDECTYFCDGAGACFENTLSAISLISPDDNNRTFHTNPEFIFKVVDAEQTEFNCDLLVNDIIKSSNISVQNNTETIFKPTLDYGNNQIWKVNCSDGLDMNTSESRTINITYIELSITYFAPPDDIVIGDNATQFEFGVSGELLQYYCEIIVNNISKYINSSVQNETLTKIVINLDEGNNYWNLSCNDTTSPIFNVISDTIKPTITLGEPINNTITNYNSILLHFNIADANPDECYNKINGVQNQTISTSVSGNYNITIWDLTEDWYNWSIVCIDEGLNTNESETLNFYIDLTNPFISSISPANNSEQSDALNVSFIIVYEDTSFVYSVRSNLTFCNDTNIFSLDYTDVNESLTSVSLNETRSLGIDTYCYDTRFCDGHTTKELSDEFKSPEVKDKEIDFINFKLKPKDKDNINYVYTKKLIDRWEFGWNINELKKTEIDLISLYKINYIENSEYTAHFIIYETEQWIDFEGFEKVKVKKINDYHYVIETTPDKKELIAKSVGELNCVSETYTFDVVFIVIPECITNEDCAYDERCISSICVPTPISFWNRFGMMLANNIVASLFIFAIILLFIGFGIKYFKD